MAVVFVNGIPAKITREDFRTRFGQNFPDLLVADMNDYIDLMIEDVYIMFAGVNRLWEHLDSTTYFYKTQHCYCVLLAWYIANTYSQYSVGVAGTGGMPIREKRIGGVTIKFGLADEDGLGKTKNYRDPLAFLKTNTFGYLAYSLLKAASANAIIRGGYRIVR